MKITDLFSEQALQHMIEQGFVRAASHPTKPLVIYGYTEKAAYAREWNDVTRNCRGLIYNTITNEIVARPFPKFFNYGELTDMDKVKMQGPIQVTEKMDGSLGIVYFDGDDWAVATRGSFTSDQAVWATKRLREGDTTSWAALDFDSTTLVEIVYPENRIVVNYDFSGLVFLAQIDIETGRDLALEQPMYPSHWESAGEPVVEHHDFRSFLDVMAAPDRENTEGYVVHFVNTDLRVKIKGETYVRLHRVITGATTRRIWEVLVAGESLDVLLTDVPDEFYVWVKATVANLTEAHENVIAKARAEYAEIEHYAYDRKTFAEHAGKTENPAAMFSLLDGRDLSEWAWKQIRPEHEVAVWGFQKTEVEA